MCRLLKWSACCLVFSVLWLCRPAWGDFSFLPEGKPYTDEQKNYLAERAKVRPTISRMADVNIAQAVQQGEKLLVLDRQTFGNVHRETADGLYFVADLYYRNQDFFSCVKAHDEIVEITAKLLGEEHWRVREQKYARNQCALMGKRDRQARNALPKAYELRDQAQALNDAGDYKKALEVADRAGELFDALFGKKSPDYATVLMFEGRAYRELSQFEKAEAVLEEAAQIYRGYYGGKCLYFGRAQRDLGNLYSKRREYVRAEQAFRATQEILEQECNGRGTELAGLLSDLAFVYGEQGKTSRAEAIYRKALDLIVEAVGKENLEYAISLTNLGDQLRTEGKLDEAEKTLREAMDLFGRLNRQNSPGFARTALGLAAVLILRGGKAEEALKLLDQNRHIRAIKLDDVGLDNAELLVWEAIAQQQLKDFSAADAAIRKALAIRRELFGPRNPNTLEAVVRAGDIDYDWYNAYLHARKFDDARKTIGQILELLTTYYGADDWRTIEARLYAVCLEKFAKLTDEQRRRSDESLETFDKADKLLSAAECEKAVPILDAAIKAREELYGPRDLYLGRLLFELGRTHGALGHPNLAEPLLHRAADLYRESYGVRHRPPIVCDLLFQLANIHEERGDFASAVPLLADARMVQKETAGPTTDYFSEYTLELARALIEIGEFEKAQALLDENLVRQEQIGGKQGGNYTRTLHILFVLHSRNNNLAQAKTCFHQADKTLIGLCGLEPTWDLIELHLDWGVYMATQGDVQKAFAQLQWVRMKLATATDRRFPRIHQLHLRCLRGLARAYERSDEFDKCEVVLREVLDTQRKRFPGFLPACQDDVDRLAILLDRRAGKALQADKLDEYVASFQKEVDAWTEIFGRDHWRTRTARSELEVARKVAGLNAENCKRYQAAFKGGPDALMVLGELIGKENTVYQRAELEMVSALFRKGDFSEGEKRGQALLAASAALLGPNSDLAGATWLKLGEAEKQQGHYDAAAAKCAKAAAILAEALGPQSLAFAKALSSQACWAEAAGDSSQAARAFRTAYPILSRFQTEDPSAYHWFLMSYSRHCSRLDDDERAEMFLRRIYDGSARLAKNDSNFSYLVSAAAGNLGELYTKRREYKQAEPLLREATDKCRVLYGEQDTMYADALEDLANLLREQGDNLLPGSLYQQAIDIRTAKDGAESFSVAIALMNRGKMHLSRGDFPPAGSDFDKAQAIMEKLHRQSTLKFEECLRCQGDLASQEGNKQRAAALYGEYLAITRREASLLAGQQTETQQLARARRWHEVLGWYLSLDPEGASLERAYGDVLAWKGSVFAHQRGLRSGLANKTAKSAAYQALFHQWEKLTSQFATLTLRAPYPEERDTWREQVLQLAAERDAIESQLRDLNQVVATPTPTAAELAGALPEKAALVDIIAYERRVPSTEHKGQWKVERRFLAFVVRHGRKVERIDLGAVEDVSKEVDAWLKANDSGRPGGRATLSELALLGRPLYKRLWEPLEKSLEGADVILVSPDGAIARFPMAALPGVDADSFLVEERALVTVPVPAMLPQLLATQKIAEGGDLVAFGDVAYGGRAGEMDRAGDSGREGDAGRSWLPASFSKLENTGPEADGVAARFAACFPKAAASVLKGGTSQRRGFPATGTQLPLGPPGDARLLCPGTDRVGPGE